MTLQRSRWARQDWLPKATLDVAADGSQSLAVRQLVTELRATAKPHAMG